MNEYIKEYIMNKNTKKEEIYIYIYIYRKPNSKYMHRID